MHPLSARTQVARAVGLEPTTYGFGDRCSTKLSYTPHRRDSNPCKSRHVRCLPPVRTGSLRKPGTTVFSFLVGMTGFEPATSASRTQRSTNLSHIPMDEFGRHDRIRTCDFLIRSQVLYPAELRADDMCFNGLNDGSRTRDLRLRRAMLYPTELHSDIFGWQGGIRTRNPSVNSRTLCH